MVLSDVQLLLLCTLDEFDATNFAAPVCDIKFELTALHLVVYCMNSHGNALLSNTLFFQRKCIVNIHTALSTLLYTLQYSSEVYNTSLTAIHVHNTHCPYLQVLRTWCQFKVLGDSGIYRAVNLSMSHGQELWNSWLGCGSPLEGLRT